MAAATGKHTNCLFSTRFSKKKRYSKEEIRRKTAEQKIQRNHGAEKRSKVQEIIKVRQEKQRKIQDKRRKKQRQREIQRKILAMDEKVALPTCQALNRLQRQCKSKVLDKSNFCKIHQFCDSGMSGLVQCIGRNKLLKRCIKSVSPDEKYCNYHKIASQIK